MRVVLMNPRGFCAGVRMAVRCLEIVRERVPGPLYVYHEIVHNRDVVKSFQQQGFVFVDQIDAVPVGATLVFSAHGVSPEIRRQAASRQLRTIDATCPLVAKVHTEAIRFADSGYHILLIGHQGHDEVVGTLGEVPDQITLVQDESDVRRLEFPPTQPLAFLTQTTLSVDETQRIVNALQQRFPHIEGPASDDICYATHNRQQAVREAAGQLDLLLVVGSQNSSNSRRLAELAAELNCAAQLVDRAEMLQPAWFTDVRVLGITAGASAPESAVQAMIEWLSSRFPVEISSSGQAESQRVFPLPADLDRIAQA